MKTNTSGSWCRISNGEFPSEMTVALRMADDVSDVLFIGIGVKKRQFHVNGIAAYINVKVRCCY